MTWTSGVGRVCGVLLDAIVRLLALSHINPNVLTLMGLVVNTYAAPAASGCKIEAGGLTIPIDSLVNSGYHLPAAAGTNEAILDFNVAYASPFTVYP